MKKIHGKPAWHTNKERKQWQMDIYEGSAAQLDSRESDFLDACLKALKTELNAHVKMLKSTNAKPDHGTLYKYLVVTKEEKNQHVKDQT